MIIGLVKGIHDLPVEKYICNEVVDVTDVSRIMGAVLSFLIENYDEKKYAGIDLYVTGLTVVLGCVMKYCYDFNIPLTLYHYDKDSGIYFTQVVIGEEPAMFRRNNYM